LELYGSGLAFDSSKGHPLTSVAIFKPRKKNTTAQGRVHLFKFRNNFQHAPIKQNAFTQQSQKRKYPLVI